MKRVLCILESGFEEIEAIAPVNLLRRADVEVVMAGVSSREVTGRCGIRVTADVLLEEVSGDDFDALFLPGGPAVMELRKNAEVISLIRAFHAQEKLIAAICAAPLLLKDAGLLENANFTAHFSTQGELPEILDASSVYCSHLLTSRSAGTAIEFGLVFVEILCGVEVKNEISAAIMV